MVCSLARIPPTSVGLADSDINNVVDAAENYRGYTFSNLHSGMFGIANNVPGTTCNGSKMYSVGQRIGRAILGVFLVLATGFLGLLSPRVRSLFHAEHNIHVHFNPQDTGYTMSLNDDGHLKFTQNT